MSALGRLRKRWNYETNVPRCLNCTHYRKPGIFLRDSLPIKSPAMCKAGDFTVAPNACCDRWESKDGDRLA
jgi:hypothetical protein